MWRERFEEWNRNRKIRNAVDRFIEAKGEYREWNSRVVVDSVGVETKRSQALDRNYNQMRDSFNYLVDSGIPFDVWVEDKDGRAFKLLSDTKRSYINRLLVM